MTFDIAIVLIVIVVTLYLFISERFGIDTVSIITMTLLMVTGVLTPQEGFAGFTNTATITVACMFVISSAIFKSGALNGVNNLLTSYGKKNYYVTLILLMLISGGLSAFMNDTAVVALLLPVVVSVSKNSGISPSKLLMPLSFGALLGGICTLIGTSTNILVSGIAERQGHAPISMFEMTSAGVCFLVAGLLYMIFAGRFLLPDRKVTDILVEEFDMGNYLTEIVLLSDSKSVGKAIKDSQLVRELDVKILQISREGNIILPFPELIFEAGDVLKVSCDIDKLKKLIDRQGVAMKSEKAITQDDLLQSKIILVEAIVSNNSKIDGKSLQEYNFRNRHAGASVLAIRHRDEIVHEKIGKSKLVAGDVLLISATQTQLYELRKNKDILIYSETVHRHFRLSRLLWTLLIVIGIVSSAAMGIAPIVLSATVGVVLMIILKLIKPEEAYESIDWKVIFMLAGVLSLGAALEKTGAAALLANGIVNSIGSLGPKAVLSAFFGLTFLSTNFMSNNATAALLAPIAIVTADSMSVDPRPFILAVAFAASLSFMTPMGYQTNAMIYGPGNYKFKDYLKVGTPLNIIFWILASIIIPYFYPF